MIGCYCDTRHQPPYPGPQLSSLQLVHLPPTAGLCLHDPSQLHHHYYSRINAQLQLVNRSSQLLTITTIATARHCETLHHQEEILFYQASLPSLGFSLQMLQNRSAGELRILLWLCLILGGTWPFVPDIVMSVSLSHNTKYLL